MDQVKHANTLTIQMSESESHLMVMLPSVSLSQKQDADRLMPQSDFWIITQLAIILKFLVIVVSAFRT